MPAKRGEKLLRLLLILMTHRFSRKYWVPVGMIPLNSTIHTRLIT
jgi:hypothetical protein